jgi:hypothetical protein
MFTFNATPNPRYLENVGSATGELRGAPDNSLVWSGPLVNEIRPLSAIVSDDGRFVATFDNWYIPAFGEHTIVVYDAAGQVLLDLSLKQVLSESEWIRLPRIASWGGEHRLEGGTLVLAAEVIPWDLFLSRDLDEAYREWSSSPDRFTYRRILIETGAVLNPPEKHLLDEFPSHECPDHLESRSHIRWRKPPFHLETVCVRADSTSRAEVENHPTAFWRATRSGWQTAERGQYRNEKPSGTWKRWSSESQEPCLIKYSDGEVVSSECP